MSIRRIFFLSFLIALGIWAWFSWPLPRHVAAGIPAAAHLEPAEVRPLIPGDHLQFMYYCWLAGDMAAGQTPLFYNLYEFNTGEEKGGYRPDAYYFPFSLIYAIGASFGGRALGWNLTGFLSLWMTYFLTWLLVRRYAKPEWLAGCAAMIAIILPFRWINLCGGSPAGFACMWIPAILLGIDLAVRDGKAAGGFLAGVSILCAAWTDNHIFFFGSLAVPVWTVIALAAEGRPRRAEQLFLSSDVNVGPLLAEAVRSDATLRSKSSLRPSFARHSGLREGGSTSPEKTARCKPFDFDQGIEPVEMQRPYKDFEIPRREIDRFQHWREAWQKIFIALLPVPLFLGLALAFPMIMQHIAGAAADQHLGSSVAARVWREIALYSPSRNGFFSWFSTGVSSHIYIGLSALAFLVAGWAGLLINTFRGRNGNSQRLLIMALITFAILGIMALALGTHGPFHAIFLRICRKVIPPYAMIRQPAKIFCLMPVFLAVATGMGLSAIFVHLKTSQARFIAAVLFCGTIGAEYVLRVHPTISILDSKQGAYAAAANAAAAAGMAPHALVVPLWPGDAHYSSIYQHYASLYRVRMVNGYNPFVSKSYFDNVFRRYESVNQGWLTDGQIDELLRRGINYLILHEDLFPEKVSPFPVGWTLKQFLAHPRLQLLKQDGRAWAFKMLPAPDEKVRMPLRGIQLSDGSESRPYPVILNPDSPEAGMKDLSRTDTTAEIPRSTRNDNETLPKKNIQSILDRWSIFGCARQWQAESCLKGKAFALRSNSPMHDAYAVLDSPGAIVLTPPQRAAATAPLNWMVRMRGEGAIIAQTMLDGKPAAADLIDIAENEWTWVSIPLPNLGVFAPLNLKLEWENGAIECDRILLTAGEWIPPAKGRTIDLQAPCMFHAGYTSLSDNTVVLEKEREERALIFYGPKLPIEKGRYRVELVFTSPAPKGTLLGQFNIKRHDRDVVLNWIPVVADAQSPAEFTQPASEPMHLEFRFLGNGSLKINSIRLTRLD